MMRAQDRPDPLLTILGIPYFQKTEQKRTIMALPKAVSLLQKTSEIDISSVFKRIEDDDRGICYHFNCVHDEHLRSLGQKSIFRSPTDNFCLAMNTTDIEVR